MSTDQRSAPAVGRPLNASAVALMLLLCLTWGFNQVVIKQTMLDIPPFLQAAIRSCGALPVLLVVARLRGVKLFERDGTLWLGLFAGAMFSLEFILIYRGLQLTTASRAAVFLYTTPFFVAFGSWWLLGERLRAVQWGGLALCFIGVALAIGVPQASVDGQVLLGDLMIVGGASMWAAVTVLVKATALLKVPPEKALGYQVAVSIPVFGLAAALAGEAISRVPTTLTVVLMTWQAIWVVGLTFLLWFVLVKTYSASKLSAFTFITPLFGVAAGYFILHDALTPAFGVAAFLVIAGLILVNRPNPVATDPLLSVTKT